jgi:DNA invertase Pin-like site-specific DNA recombinase
MTIYAYLRVSKVDMTAENQRHEIQRNGFAIDEYFYEEGVSGSKDSMERPAFSKMIAKMQQGDSLVVTKVDRLGRKAADVLTTVNRLKSLGVMVKVIQFGGMDVCSPAGKMMLAMLAACAEMERDTLIERTNAGIARTKAQGTKFGAPLTIKPEILKEMCEKKEQGMTYDQLTEQYEIPRMTIARNVKKWAGKLEEYSNEYFGKQSQIEMKKAA